MSMKTKFSFAMLFLISASAQAQALHLVYPASSPLKAPVGVAFSLDGNQLKVHFEVHTPTINAKTKLGPGQFPYQFDVVEVFVSTTGMQGDHVPYYEFEVSPFNEDFQVKIPGNKQPFIEGIHLAGFTHSVSMIPGGWVADMSIPLDTLEWKGDPKQIIGNAFAIFGKSGSRSFWSLNLPVEVKPNFHRPEFFKPLLD